MVREIPWHGKTLPRGLAVFDHAHTIRIRYIKKSIGQTNVKSVTSITIQIHELAIQQNQYNGWNAQRRWQEHHQPIRLKCLNTDSAKSGALFPTKGPDTVLL
jgi:hypothetical protein